MRAAIPVLTCALLASGANASNWVPIAAQKQGTVLLDTDSVEHRGANVSAWIELKQANADSAPVAYELDHWSIDCNDMTVATLATMQFDRAGKRTAGDALSAYYPERTAITPNSLGFEVYRKVCR